MVTRNDVIEVLNNAIGCATDDETIECLKVAKECVEKHYCDCITRNCLSCSNSHSESGTEGDILHCMERNGEVVSETDWCAMWN